jgi:soluble lytic murein transglycosylase-like protein
VRYLRKMLERFDNDTEMAVAAYNAGPQAVARHRGVPPYEETQRYVKRVLAEYR